MKGSLRIRKAQKKLGFSQKDETPYDDYISRLIKLVPADALALYIFGENTIPEDNIIAQIVFGVICLGFIIFTRYKRTQEVDDDKPQWSAISIALISFIIWVYVVGDLFARLGLQEKWLGSLIMALWVSLTPYLYKGDDVEN